jgi:hypothetical protein
MLGGEDKARGFVRGSMGELKLATKYAVLDVRFRGNAHQVLIAADGESYEDRFWSQFDGRFFCYPEDKDKAHRFKHQPEAQTSHQPPDTQSATTFSGAWDVQQLKVLDYRRLISSREFHDLEKSDQIWLENIFADWYGSQIRITKDQSSSGKGQKGVVITKKVKGWGENSSLKDFSL